MIVLISVLFGQARIEWYKYRNRPNANTIRNLEEETNEEAATDQETGQAASDTKSPNFDLHIGANICVLRSSTLLSICIISLIALWMFASFLVKKDDVHLTRVRIHILVSCVLYNIFPLLYLKKKPDMDFFICKCPVFLPYYNLNT